VPVSQADSPSDRSPFQFSLAAALFGMTLFAVVCSITKCVGVVPYWSILPGVLMFFSYRAARQGKDPDLPWGLFAIAWCVALYDTVEVLVHVFSSNSMHQRVLDLRAELLTTYGSGIAIPLLLSFPVAYYAARSPRGRRSFGRKWLVASIVVGFVDVTLVALLIVALVGWIFVAFP